MPRPQRWILSLAAVCAAVACGDGASTEPPVTVAASASTSRSSGDVVKLLKRDDALQAITVNALRGYKRANVPLIINAVGLWLVGLAGGYVLALTDAVTVPVFWPTLATMARL